MKPVTKYLVYGGIATVLLGPPLVIGTGVSVASGAGTLLAGTLKDMLPEFVESFQDYQPGNTDGIFGDIPTAPDDTEPQEG